MTSRPISSLEDFYRLRTLNRYSSCCQVVGDYSIELSRELLWKALRSVLLNYSQLSIQVHQKDEKWELRLLESYVLDDVLEIRPETETLELLREFNKQTFDLGTKTPLWKLVLVGKSKLLFCFDHLLLDGMSGRNFHVLLKDSLNRVLTQTLPVDTTQPLFDTSRDSGLQINPEPAAFIDYGISASVLTRTLLRELTPKWIKSLLQRFTSVPLIPDQYVREDIPRHTAKFDENIDLVSLSSTEVANLISVARDHSVKLTALFAMLYHVALYPVVGYKHTVATVPVDLRRFMYSKPGPPELGLFMGVLEVSLPPMETLDVVPEDPSWNLATAIQKQIDGGLPESRSNIGLLRLVENEKFLKSKLATPRTTTMEFSNLGSYANNKLQEVKLTRLTFSQSLGLTGAYFGVNIIGTDTGIDLVLTSLPELKQELMQTKTRFLSLISEITSK